MDGLHSPHLTANLIAYSSALLISALLLALTLRAARLPGTPLANIAFALCAVLWTGGGLAQTALAFAGQRPFAPRAFQYTAAVAVLVPVLARWRARRVAQGAALAGAALTVVVWSGRIPFDTLRPWIAYYGSAVLIAGFAAAGARRRGADFWPSVTIVLAGCSAAILVSARMGPTLQFLLSHLILAAVLCAFILFARFRFADTFVRYSVRILLAGTLAASLISTIESRFLRDLAERSHSVASFHVLAMILVANTVLLSLTFLDEAISRRVIRWLFRPPDYRGETRKLAARLSHLEDEGEMAAALEETAQRSLDLAEARVEAPDGQAALDGELVELDFEVLVPVYSQGIVKHVLRASPGPNRPALVSRDLLYLRDLSAQFGNRVDAVRREREAVERQSRESLLVQQVTEAELRALRAQVNPHFLFNSLNTIADLTARDPGRAEAMTVRLAAVFRHVLAHSSRPLTTVRDELEFLRTCLYIEEARFGDRLQVSIDAAGDVADAPIPSLILQPLVENALKHGLGPKVGVGRLWIRADRDDGDVRVVVEDDGLGLDSARGDRGVGLSNIADRLRTMYGNRASVRLEARDGGGCVATVRIPGDA